MLTVRFSYALCWLTSFALVACNPGSSVGDGGLRSDANREASTSSEAAVVPLGDAASSDDVRVANDAQAPNDATAPAPLTECSGAAFYVSTRGSDAAEGSSARPWATLAHAAAMVTTAGATIHVAAGTYTETEQVRLAPGVCLEGTGRDAVVRSQLSADWTALLEMTSPEGTDGHQHVSNLRFDGQNLHTFWGINVAGRSNVSIHDVEVVDFKDRGVIMSGRSDNREMPPTRYATGLSFYRNTILNCAAYNTSNGVYGRGALNIGGTEGMRIYENVITQNQRPVGFNGWTIKAWNGGHNRALSITRNTLTKIPFTGAYGGDNGWDFAVEMFDDEGTEFANNTVVGGAFDTNRQRRGSYPYSVWIHDNSFRLLAPLASNNHGIILEFDSDAVRIENNVIDSMSNCIAATPRPGDLLRNVSIIGNLCSHVGLTTGNGSNASFINLHSGQANFSIEGLTIENNTFLADPSNRPWWGVELGGSTMGTISNVRIVNNIIAHTNSGAIVQGAPGGVVMRDVTITNNDLFDSNASNDPVWTGTVPRNYTAANNLHADPLFVSATDYHLQAGSPLIDRGANVGRPFRGSAPDVGYAEF